MEADLFCYVLNLTQFTNQQSIISTITEWSERSSRSQNGTEQGHKARLLMTNSAYKGLHLSSNTSSTNNYLNRPHILIQIFDQNAPLSTAASQHLFDLDLALTRCQPSLIHRLCVEHYLTKTSTHNLIVQLFMFFT